MPLYIFDHPVNELTVSDTGMLHGRRKILSWFGDKSDHILERDLLKHGHGIECPEEESRRLDKTGTPTVSQQLTQKRQPGFQVEGIGNLRSHSVWLRTLSQSKLLTSLSISVFLCLHLIHYILPFPLSPCLAVTSHPASLLPRFTSPLFPFKNKKQTKKTHASWRYLTRHNKVQ